MVPRKTITNLGALVTGSQTARYRVVPPKIDRRRLISTVGSRLKKKSTVRCRLREKSPVGDRLRKKKGRRRGKEEKKEEEKKEYSPVRRRSPCPQWLFLPREETERLPARGERSRRHCSLPGGTID
ncbi:hypothetical protein GW17_00047301 [Ensete ventricosum]|nr:hypothetical protein GW17_00047301 [Ensete ventricosum]